MGLAFEDRGRGPVVVLLHGFPLDRQMWSEQWADLASDYRVIAPDLIGHGESPPAGDIATMESQARAVLELLDDLEIREPVVVGGLSMGGYITLELAVRHAHRLRGVLLMNTKASADTPEAAKVREDRAKLVESQQNVRPVVEAMVPKLFAPVTRTSRPDLVARIEAQMLRTPPAGVAAALRGMAVRPERTPDLPFLRIPTLVLAGLDDQLIPMDESERLARTIPGAKLVAIKESGHLSPIEQPGAVNLAIREFLEALDDGQNRP